MKLKRCRVVLLVLCAALMLHLKVSGQGPAGVLTVVDFETGDTSQMRTQKAADDSIVVVTSPVRAGKYAARTWLRATDAEVSKGRRAEFTDSNKQTKILIDADYWYSLSLFLPDGFVAPAKTNAILFQWHTQQGGPSPVLAIRAQKDEWVITTSVTGKMRTIRRIPLQKNRWTDWVVHARWSAHPTGYWTIWKDGAAVVEEKEIVTQYPEGLGPYAKFGQYHSVEEVPENVVYVDEYRVAGPGSTYADVAPPTEQRKSVAK